MKKISNVLGSFVRAATPVVFETAIKVGQLGSGLAAVWLQLLGQGAMALADALDPPDPPVRSGPPLSKTEGDLHGDTVPPGWDLPGDLELMQEWIDKETERRSRAVGGRGAELWVAIRENVWEDIVSRYGDKAVYAGCAILGEEAGVPIQAEHAHTSGFVRTAFAPGFNYALEDLERGGVFEDKDG